MSVSASASASAPAPVPRDSYRPTPPPTASAPPKPPSRPEHWTAQHQRLPTPPPTAVPREDDVEALLSFREAQHLGRSRIRGVYCLWNGCDALMASIDLLEKHLHRHISLLRTADAGKRKADNQDGRMDGHGDGDNESMRDDLEFDLGIRCRWNRCPQHSLASYDALRNHLATHINKLVSEHCPHKECAKRAMSDRTAVHALNFHPAMWTRDLLKPTPTPYRPPKPQAPPDFDGRRILANFAPYRLDAIPPYLITTQPVPQYRRPLPNHNSTPSTPPPAPTPPRPIPSRVVTLRARHAASSPASPAPSSSSSQQQAGIAPIEPTRDPDDFWPMNGDAESQAAWWGRTSSIFPPLLFTKKTPSQELWLKCQRTAQWQRGGTTIGTRKREKEKMPTRPLFFVGADVLARERDAKRARFEQIRGSRHLVTEANVDVESGASAIPAQADQEAPGPDKYPVERIVRASIRRATRLTGRTIGYEHLEQMVAFEARGVELGELPADYSLQK